MIAAGRQAWHLGQHGSSSAGVPAALLPSAAQAAACAAVWYPQPMLSAAALNRLVTRKPRTSGCQCMTL